MVALVTVALQIILQVMQVIMKIYEKWIGAWNEEQKTLALKRMEDTLANFKKLVEGAHDSLNEDALLKSLGDEKSERYLIYRKVAADALAAGQGIDDLCKITQYGFGGMVTKHKDNVIGILNMVLSPYEKAQMVAAEIVK